MIPKQRCSAFVFKCSLTFHEQEKTGCNNTRRKFRYGYDNCEDVTYKNGTPDAWQLFQENDKVTVQ